MDYMLSSSILRALTSDSGNGEMQNERRCSGIETAARPNRARFLQLGDE
jgi:hypothetical protein